ncbi:MAG: hypothetical protein ACI9PP_002282 [Halobacteriales archaeon]|jgi:hypothetical protein
MPPNSFDRSGRPNENPDSHRFDRYRVSEPDRGVIVIYDIENEAAWIRSTSAVNLSEFR